MTSPEPPDEPGLRAPGPTYRFRIPGPKWLQRLAAGVGSGMVAGSMALGGYLTYKSALAAAALAAGKAVGVPLTYGLAMKILGGAALMGLTTVSIPVALGLPAIGAYWLWRQANKGNAAPQQSAEDRLINLVAAGGESAERASQILQVKYGAERRGAGTGMPTPATVGI